MSATHIPNIYTCTTQNAVLNFTLSLKKQTKQPSNRQQVLVPSLLAALCLMGCMIDRAGSDEEIAEEQVANEEEAPAVACSNEGETCDDQNPCTSGDSCQQGVCKGTALDCSRLDDECSIGVCDVQTGMCETSPINEGMSCEGHDPCTSSGQCEAGSCIGGGDPPVDKVRLNEVYGGSTDYIELINTGECTVNLQGVTVRWSYGAACGANDGKLGSYTFDSTTLAPSAVYRIVDDASGLGSNESYVGGNLCDNPVTGAWLSLCEGDCVDTCDNLLDYFEKDGSGTLLEDPPACATFTNPLDVSGSGDSDSVQRVAFTNPPNAGVGSDWTIATYTRD